MINPDGVRHQIHGNVIQSTSRALMEQVSFDRNTVTSREWGAYPIIKFPDIPEIDVLMLPRQDQPPLGVGESASVPSAAAIANAIFDATGVRFREPPFTPERILAGLQRRSTAPRRPRCRRRRQPRCGLRPVARIRSSDGAVRWQRPRRCAPRSSASPRRCCHGGRLRRSRGRMRRSIRPRPSPAASNSPRSATARSATPPQSGILNAGGRAARDAVRHDLQHQHHARCRDRHRRLVLSRLRARHARGHPSRRPASLSGLSLHAFCQDDRRRPAGALRLSDGASAGACRNRRTTACLSVQLASAAGGMERAVPSVPACSKPNAAKSATWNRGAYLVEGLGHCGACHSPRNALGAEQAEAYLGRRFRGRLGSAAADLAVARADSLERGRAVRLFALGRIPFSRRRGGADGAGGERTCGAARSGHPRHGGLPRLVQGAAPSASRRRTRWPPDSKPRPAPRVASASSIGARLYEGACAVCHRGRRRRRCSAAGHRSR